VHYLVADEQPKETFALRLMSSLRDGFIVVAGPGNAEDWLGPSADYDAGQPGCAGWFSER
jgi:hypothetical protein